MIEENVKRVYLLAAFVRLPLRRGDLFDADRFEPLDFICLPPRFPPVRFPRCPLDLLLPADDFPRLTILNCYSMEFCRSTTREREIS